MLNLDRQSQSTVGDMDPEEFVTYGNWAIKWIAHYLTDVEHPLLPHAQPGDIAKALPATPPQQPASVEHVFGEFQRLIVAHCTHWNSKRFMGYFGLGPSAISLLAELLESTLDQTRMLWSTGPAATELERVTLDWVRQLLGLPEHMFGMFHTNSRVDLALVAAIESLQEFGISDNGLTGMSPFRCYASAESHASVEKAMVVTGLGKKNVRKIAVDATFRMDPEALRAAIEEDIESGFIPLAVIATVGTTSTTSIDPVPQIADICERYGLWLHVDAAYAGLFAIDPQMGWILEGCERADSFSTNPHKPLFVPFNYSIFYIKRPELLKTALGVSSVYLHHGSTADVDLNDYTDKIPHRCPGLVLWMVFCYFGVDGIIARHREHRRLAHLVEEWIGASPDFELMAPVHFPVVCLRAHPHRMDNEEWLNTLNERLLKALNNAGDYFISDTVLDGKFTLRIAIGNIKTTEEDVRGIWAALQAELGAETRISAPSSHFWEGSR